MKVIIRLLIFVEFAVIIFVPGIYMSRLMLLPMFASMAVLVYLYWRVMFWVGRKDAAKVLGEEPELNLYVGKIPADTTADLTRGRLCKQGDRLVLMKRTSDKEHRQKPCEEVWSINIDDITSVGFGKVLPARKGFILFKGYDEIKFTSAKAAKSKDLIYKALGWEMPEAES